MLTHWQHLIMTLLTCNLITQSLIIAKGFCNDLNMDKDS